MSLQHMQAARPYSLWLARQLDGGRLDLARLADWLTRQISVADYSDFADWQQLQDNEDEEGLAAQLRILRRHVLAQIMTRDLCRLSDLAEVTRTITEFADFAVNTALSFAYRYYADIYGTPLGRYSHAPQFLSVVAMGKAGGFELNVSSDIDLIFVYPESGATDGRRERSNQEFFTKVGQKLIALLHDITAEGQVFRVDMRLRPDGDSGALVCSETALEQYLVAQGREWERYAWCKGRVVTPYANGIAALVRPFVFRKYLDYNAYDAMRDLHRQISREVGRQGMADNVKLGAGGIREVEFVAQIFQMIRGGQNHALQLKGTRETLAQLGESGILAADTVAQLQAAYVFLRDTEHRLQYWDDCQTQMLPAQPEQQSALAQSMGFNGWQDFQAALNAHRDRVHRIFTDILSESEPQQADHRLSDIWTLLPQDTDAAAQRLVQIGFGGSAAAQLAQLKTSGRYRQLSAQAQQRFDAVIPRLLDAAAQSAHADTVLARLLDFLETISRRSAYLAFLQQYPEALAQVAQLMAQSAWLTDYLHAHPILLDELLSAQLTKRLDWAALAQELSGSLNACGSDTEAKMDALRRFKHAQTFRLAVQDLAVRQPVEQLSDELSYLADLLIGEAVRHAWQSMPKKHRAEPQFAVIAYGKLGGKELGYTSDLDLVYLYEDDHPDAADNYVKLARRLGTWLSGHTGAGALYELDLRLRPDGDDGFLVHSLAAFEQYQQHKAWTWEHQALTRARFAGGDRALGEQFEQIRRRILTQPRDSGSLKHDITAMRDKIAATHPPVSDSVKYARGGIVDVEFIVQYLVLAHSADAPELLENYGNIALLDMAAQRSLIDAEAAAAARTAYRSYRQIQHNQHLRDTAPHCDAALTEHYRAVQTLWAQVFQAA